MTPGMLRELMKIRERVSLKPFNTFGVEACSRYFTDISRLDDVYELIDWLRHHDNPLLIIGGGSNVLFKRDYPGMVAHCSLSGKEVLYADDEASYIRAGAGENWHEFVRWTIDQGCAGLENLSLIPGTVGAAPVQNIGAYGVELKDVFFSLEAVDLESGELRVFDTEMCRFAYRDSIFKSVSPGRYFITSVTFRLPHKPEWKLAYAGLKDKLNGAQPSARLISDTIMTIRQEKLPDPSVLGNAGSFFKNPVLEKRQWKALQERFVDLPGYAQEDPALIKTSAAWLIDRCGLKGFRAGAAGVSKDHALVLVNYGGATGVDIWTVAETVMDTVKSEFSVTLEPEPKVIA